MTVVLVEDEGIALRKLDKILSNFSEVKIVGKCKSLKQINAFLAENPEPDLYFMDIHLSDGIIFELLSDKELKSPIIFTTAYDQYAIKAFKQNSVDYLLKPFEEADVKNALEKYKNLYQKNISNPNVDIHALSQLLMQQNNPQSYRERIKVKVGDKIRSISLEDITHFFSENKATYLYTSEDRIYPLDLTLDNIFKELNPKEWFKVSRSFIVSINSIDEVISYSNSRLKVGMKNKSNQEIVVAREKVKLFKEWLG